jgi:hypothetical protein
VCWQEFFRFLSGYRRPTLVFLAHDGQPDEIAIPFARVDLVAIRINEDATTSFTTWA